MIFSEKLASTFPDQTPGPVATEPGGTARTAAGRYSTV